jgi:DNA processing protein
VQGCLALIRDGATLARDAGDVLEALGRLSLTPAPVAAPVRDDSVSTALLAALDTGASEFDELVARSGVGAAAALAALSLLELDGTVEAQGATRYARVAAPSRGEELAR